MHTVTVNLLTVFLVNCSQLPLTRTPDNPNLFPWRFKLSGLDCSSKYNFFVDLVAVRWQRIIYCSQVLSYKAHCHVQKSECSGTLLTHTPQWNEKHFELAEGCCWISSFLLIINNASRFYYPRQWQDILEHFKKLFQDLICQLWLWLYNFCTTILRLLMVNPVMNRDSRFWRVCPSAVLTR